MKKVPIKVVVLGVVSAILLTATAGLIWRLAINHSFVSDYNNQVYAEEKEKNLLTMNSPEAYLPYYNLGNVAFKNADYDTAIAYYNQALENYPPEDRECQIRINLALAMCNTIDFYHIDTQEDRDTALIVLYKARDVLTAKGGASPEGHEGHNEDAQQLKEDIDEMIKKLENPDPKPEPEPDPDPQPGGNTPDPDPDPDPQPGPDPDIKRKIIVGLGNDNTKFGKLTPPGETPEPSGTYNNPW